MNNETISALYWLLSGSRFLAEFLHEKGIDVLGVFSALGLEAFNASGSVVECLTRDLGGAGSSLTSITALCP